MGSINAKLKSILKKNDIIISSFEFSEKDQKRLSPPIAPALLYKNDLEVFTVFHLINRESNILTFQTYDYKGVLPTINTEFSFQPLFIPHQLAVIQDKKAKWTLKKFPENGSVCYDDLSWDSIPSSEDEVEGYTNGKEWIKKETYEKYIKNDYFHLRK